MDGAELSPICEYLAYVGQNLGAETVRYVVFLDNSERFLALLPVTSISRNSELNPPEGECRAWELMEWMREKNYKELRQLNGFVATENSASMEWSKSDCLRAMFRGSLEALPVVKDTRLIGIVERTRLVTSIVVDISGRLED